MFKIYVGNLPFKVTEQDVEQAFSQFGAIDDVFLLRHRDSGKLKGFGFVTFADKSAGEAAIKEMDGKDFMGRNLKVSEAAAKDRDDRGGGDRGGYRDDRGGGHHRDDRGGHRDDRGGRGGDRGGRGGY